MRFWLKMLIVVMLVFGSAFFVTAEHSIAGELDATWIVESSQGAKDPVYKRAFAVGEKVTFDSNSVIIEKSKSKLWFKLDATQTPARFELAAVRKDMPLKQFSCRGIYRLEEDKLILCGAEPIQVGRRPDAPGDSGWILGERPTEFRATDFAFLVILKRQVK